MKKTPKKLSPQKTICECVVELFFLSLWWHTLRVEAEWYSNRLVSSHLKYDGQMKKKLWQIVFRWVGIAHTRPILYILPLFSHYLHFGCECIGLLVLAMFHMFAKKQSTQLCVGRFRVNAIGIQCKHALEIRFINLPPANYSHSSSLAVQTLLTW